MHRRRRRSQKNPGRAKNRSGKKIGQRREIRPINRLFTISK